MRPEYIVLVATVSCGLVAWAIKAVVAFTKEMAEWRVQIFGPNGLAQTLIDHGRRIELIEKRLGWEGEFDRRAPQ